MRALAILKSVVLGLSTIAASVALDSGETTSPCRARAWVRAPDLAPGEVLEGDVRIKLEGTCPDVSSYSLGLRFLERSWVKTRREGVVLPDPPMGNAIPFSPVFSNDSIFEPQTFRDEIWWTGGICREDESEQSAWKTYKNTIRDPTHWLAREEERIGFETKYTLDAGDRLSHELVHRFGILVPFTNYPPAFDMVFGNVLNIFGERTDIADAEHIYAYFVDVEFANGTRHEVPAGFTSFRAIKPAQSEMETVNVVAKHSPTCIPGQNCRIQKKQALQDELTLEVTFPNGRRLAQGSTNNLTIIIHQPELGLLFPLGVKSLRTKVEQNLKWAATFAPDNETAEAILTSGTLKNTQLRPVMDDEIFHQELLSGLMSNFEGQRFLYTRTLENGAGFSSEPISAPFNVPRYCYPSFATYYQTTEVFLEIVLEVRNHSSSTMMNTPEDDDDFAWTPMKEKTIEFHAKIPLTVYSQPNNCGSLEDEPTHYLSPDSRSPIFVASSSIPELTSRSRADRDALAPISQGRILATSDRDIVKHRYYDLKSHPRVPDPAPPYYVGDVWLRKGMTKDNGGTLKVQNAQWDVQA